MLDFLKKRMEEKKHKNQAFIQAQRWKQNTMLQECLTALRGSCTVALAVNQEAVEAVVSIAMVEDHWMQTETVPDNWLPEMSYIFWDESTLPMLYCVSSLALEHIDDVTAVAFETFLVSANMDRIIHYKDGRRYLYSVA